MKLAAFVPLLMDRFPDGAFTTASLEFVAARAVKGFPAYGELAAWLSEWWRAHRPPLPALPQPPRAPERPPPTPEERAYVRARVQEIVANMRSPFAEREPEPPRPAYLTPEQIERAGGRKQHATQHAEAAQPSDPAAAEAMADWSTGIPDHTDAEA